jgi:MarR-like DNA-binding transcriptional regulator SgrR of sgrS sRNA
MTEAVQTLDPMDWPSNPAEASAKAQLSGLVFETLVRLDEKGRPQPWLAESWTHDAARKRWIFAPRVGVVLQNGASWMPAGGIIAIPDDRPIERILADLARPARAIAVRAPDGTLSGTGPFGVMKWEPGKSATLIAHGMYWRGRPYLDAIEVQMGRTSQQQQLDLDLRKADAIEAPVTDLRRLRQKGAHLEISKPLEVVALVFDAARPVPVNVQQAVALSIDRAAIQRVLLQREGEVSAALLPQWLSGYSFVFPSARDLARARQMGAGSAALTVGYDRDDALARSIAERIVVNAMEAGLTVRTAAGAASGMISDARLMRLRIASTDPQAALEELASQLNAPAVSGGEYADEKSLLGGGRVVPLLHLPLAWQLSPRVHGWTPNGRLDDVWLDAGATP